MSISIRILRSPIDILTDRYMIERTYGFAYRVSSIYPSRVIGMKCEYWVNAVFPIWYEDSGRQERVRMMNKSRALDNVVTFGLMVSLVTIGGVYGCGEDIQCAAGTKLAVDKDGNKTCIPDPAAVVCEALGCWWMVFASIKCLKRNEKPDYWQPKLKLGKTHNECQLKYSDRTIALRSDRLQRKLQFVQCRCVSAGVDCVELLGCGFRNEGGTCAAIEDLSALNAVTRPYAFKFDVTNTQTYEVK